MFISATFIQSVFRMIGIEDNDVGTVGSTMQFFGSLPLCLLSTIKVLKCTKLIPHQFILFCELTCSYTILFTLLVCIMYLDLVLAPPPFPRIEK